MISTTAYVYISDRQREKEQKADMEQINRAERIAPLLMEMND